MVWRNGSTIRIESRSNGESGRSGRIGCTSRVEEEEEGSFLPCFQHTNIHMRTNARISAARPPPPPFCETRSQTSPSSFVSVSLNSCATLSNVQTASRPSVKEEAKKYLTKARKILEAGDVDSTKRSKIVDGLSQTPSPWNEVSLEDVNDRLKLLELAQ